MLSELSNWISKLQSKMYEIVVLCMAYAGYSLANSLLSKKSLGGIENGSTERKPLNQASHHRLGSIPLPSPRHRSRSQSY